MKLPSKPVLFCSALFLITVVARPSLAPPIPLMSYEEMMEQSDVVVIADAIRTRDAATREATGIDTDITTGWGQVETDLRIHVVFKGEVEKESLTFVHLRPVTSEGRAVLGVGWPLVFNMEGKLWQYTFDRIPNIKAKYMLFLRRLEDGRYEAVTGQRHSIHSVKYLSEPEYIEWEPKDTIPPATEEASTTDEDEK